MLHCIKIRDRVGAGPHGPRSVACILCARAHPTGVEALTATVTNTGPAVMSNRTATIALAAAALMIGSTASAGAREVVRYTAEVQPGTIVVKTAERKLYLVLGDGQALRYTVAVGRPDKQWEGKAQVNGKYVQPAWTPPAEVKADNPNLPDVIPGGTPNNPMGVAAMTLSGGEYAIHGTNKPESIGKFASYGCIRMLNQDVADLFERVDVGTQVVVTR